MKAVLLTLIAGALACRLLLPLATPDVRAGVRIRLSAGAHHPRSHALADLTELDDWLRDYEAYQALDATEPPPAAVTTPTAPEPPRAVMTSLHADDDSEYPQVT